MKTMLYFLVGGVFFTAAALGFTVCHGQQAKSKTTSDNIQTFKKGDKLPDLPGGLSPDLKCVSLYGFKWAMINNEPAWIAGTESDYRDAESRRLGIKPEQVKMKKTDYAGSCYNTGPQSCSSFCDGAGFCTLHYNPSQHYYYCACD